MNPCPSASTAPFTAVDTAQYHMVFSVPISLWTFDVLLQTDLFITKLRCAEPVTITRFRVCSPGTSCRLLTLPHSMNASSRQASPDPSVLRASPRLSGIKARCNVVYPRILVVCSSQSEPSRRTQPVVNPSRCS